MSRAWTVLDKAYISLSLIDRVRYQAEISKETKRFVNYLLQRKREENIRNYKRDRLPRTYRAAKTVVVQSVK